MSTVRRFSTTDCAFHSLFAARSEEPNGYEWTTGRGSTRLFRVLVSPSQVFRHPIVIACDGRAPWNQVHGLNVIARKHWACAAPGKQGGSGTVPLPLHIQTESQIVDGSEMKRRSPPLWEIAHTHQWRARSLEQDWTGTLMQNAAEDLSPAAPRMGRGSAQKKGVERFHPHFMRIRDKRPNHSRGVSRTARRTGLFL